MKNKYPILIVILLLGIGIARADLVANYTFEGNETAIYDYSAYGNNCTINNTTQVAGVIGHGASFNGFDSYLDCGNDSSLNFGTGDFTIMAWVKSPNVTDYNGFIVAKEDESFVGYELFESGDVNGAEADFYSQDNFDAYGTSIITDNTWHFVAGVYNSSNLSASIYVDGILEAVVEGNGNDTSNIANLLIGNLGSLYFNGTIDEVKMWNEAKDDAFILQTYNDEKPASTTHYDILSLINITLDLAGTILWVLIGFAAAIIGVMLLVAITYSLKYIITTILNIVYNFRGKK